MFKPVVDALAQVAKDAVQTHDNGTAGKTYLAHYWGDEQQTDTVRNQLNQDMTRAILKDPGAVAGIRAKILVLPPPKINMIFKLMEPIAHLVGTKIVKSGNKSFCPLMENVQFIRVPQDALEMDLLEYEEVKNKFEVDSDGEKTPVIKLKLKYGILEVTEKYTNWKGEVTRPSMAFVSAMSYRAMQIAGKILGKEEVDERRVSGMTELL